MREARHFRPLNVSASVRTKPAMTRGYVTPSAKTCPLVGFGGVGKLEVLIKA